jgi:dephospho-CoA kinase
MAEDEIEDQMPQEEKLLLADYIIQNNNDLLIPQVMKIHKLLIQ